MLLSDTAVRRPVFAVVISLLLVVFGLVAFDRLTLREYPDIDAPIVSIRTEYVGASATVVESKITQLIEERIAGIEGIKTISSSSQDGVSQITIAFDLSRDIDAAANDVRDRVAGALRRLPDEADPPEVRKADADEQVIMWFNLVSDRMTALELTDYAERHLVDRLSVLPGVARVRVSGGLEYAMRIWLDRQALAARQLTVLDIEQALLQQNVELPAGTLQSIERDFTVRVNRGYQNAADFRQLVVGRGADGYLIRLQDVARVEVGAVDWRRLYRGNGIPMVGLGIVKQSNANTLEVARAAKVERDRINASLPKGMALKQSFDSSMFIESAVKEVYETLLITAGLVILVIFLFLGDLRATLAPAVTVPVSLIATFIALYFFGYSLNLLTLLALVLAIGLVVDDSILVLENIHRRLSEGEPPLLAAYHGARQVGFAVIATTLVLVTVFLPITFLEGDAGRLFGEFAITLAAAVAFSGVIALSLTPVICAKMLRRDTLDRGLSRRVESLLGRLQRAYGRLLRAVIHHPIPVLLLFGGALGLTGWLFHALPAEFAPPEDRGAFFMVIRGPEGASFDNTTRYMLDIERRLMPLVEAGEVKRLLLRAPTGYGSGVSYNEGSAVLVLEDWSTGRRSGFAILRDVQQRLEGLSGVQAFPIMPQALGGSSAKPVQFVIGGNHYEQLAKWRDIMLDLAATNPRLLAVESDYRETKPQLRVTIHRDRAGDLGVNVLDISHTLETLLGSRRVTTFMLDGEEYDVILEGETEQSRTPDDLNNIYVRSTDSGLLIPLSNLVSLQEQADAATLNRYNRLRAITLSANLAEGYSLGEALDFLEQAARTHLPPTAHIDYRGQSLDFRESGRSAFLIFGLSLLVVLLVLAAQFESFVHPFVVILTVPLATAGALLGLALTGQTFNIYSQIGLIMLVGLAAKNGILIVEFANQLRDTGHSFEEALVRASEQRLRPILMTAITTVIGAVPLLLASGAGSEARTVLGVVIMFGVSIATLFTLILVPVAYHLLARNTRSPLTVTRQLAADIEQYDHTADELRTRHDG